VGTDTPVYSLDITATGGIRIGRGTTAQRGVGAAGYFGYNTTWAGFDIHNGTAFRRVLDLPDATPTTNHIPIFTGGEWTTAAPTLSSTVTLDHVDTPAHSSSELTTSISGAAVGDPVVLGTPASIPSNCSYFAWVSATNTVTIRFINAGAGSVDPASGSFTIKIIKI
jgi:hypothetical protein